MRSKCAIARPSVIAWSSSARAASTAARDSGPHVPAFRYARRSRTGKAARRSVTRRRMSGAAADRPVAGAAARHEHGRALVLLGGARGGRIAGAADGLPRRLRELVGAVEAVAGVGGVVAARLTGADRGEWAAGVAAAGGGLLRRARPRDLTTQAPV